MGNERSHVGAEVDDIESRRMSDGSTVPTLIETDDAV